MKKNIKKQSNKKAYGSLAKKNEALLKAKKRIPRKISTKPALKKVSHFALRQKTAKNIKKINRRSDENQAGVLTFGMVRPEHGKILLLIIAIIFVLSFFILQNMTKATESQSEFKTVGMATKRNSTLEKEINNLVAGYPIEKMTRYIAKQDPKVAAFLVAIAKKESAWGDHKPVLNGEDCYNYWGFRLKSDRMGSGGHTCFDSPEEAVSIVAARISHLVNDEKIDTPKEMVIWKCGYNCDGPEAAGSQKWIKDVDYYYRQMIN